MPSKDTSRKPASMGKFLGAASLALRMLMKGKGAQKAVRAIKLGSKGKRVANVAKVAAKKTPKQIKKANKKAWHKVATEIRAEKLDRIIARKKIEQAKRTADYKKRYSDIRAKQKQATKDSKGNPPPSTRRVKRVKIKAKTPEGRAKAKKAIEAYNKKTEKEWFRRKITRAASREHSRFDRVNAEEVRKGTVQEAKDFKKEWNGKKVKRKKYSIWNLADKLID